MKAIPTPFKDLFVIEPEVYEDSRGYFFESFSKRRFYDQTGIDVSFVQDNESCSARNVIRGLHFQLPPFAQAKLVRCTEGRILDVALDLRSDSPTFGKVFSQVLSADNRLSLFIPRGFAHGFSVLSEKAVFSYKCDNYYNPDAESGIFALDQVLNIDWLIDPSMVVISEKDRKLGLFSNHQTCF